MTDNKAVQLVVQWFTGLSFSNALLVLILAAVCWVGYAAIGAIPEHIREIQAGYERIEASHREERMQFFNLLSRVTRDEHQVSPQVVHGRQ
jgi:hypothetical protein